MISIFKNDVIEFFCDEEKFDVIPKPYPAYKTLPTWFKKVGNTIDSGRDHIGAKAMSAKKCMPLLDAMSMGFIIPLFADVNLRVNKDGSLLEAGNPSIYGPVIEFHDKEQLGGKCSPTYPGNAIKFINHWVIKTAPGYSAFFMPPVNHIEPRFTCLSGLVDTDKYVKEINFPGIWHAKDFDGVIAAGTPIVTVIPVKRSDMEREPKIRIKTKKEVEYINNLAARQNTRRSVYTNELRESRK